MFKYVFAALIGLTTLNPSFAVEPKKFSLTDNSPTQKILGAEKPIPLGEIVFLSLSPVENAPSNYVKYNAKWRIVDGEVERSFRTLPDGSVFFGSGTRSRKITIQVCVAYLFQDKNAEGNPTTADVRAELLTTHLTIGDEAVPDPDNPPNPNPPTPEPEPTFPDGNFKLASTTYKLKDKVEVGSRKAAVELSKSFEEVAKKIDNLDLVKVEDILKETTKLNRDAMGRVGVDKSKWDAFFSELQDVIYTLYADKKVLSKSEDFSVAWREIAAGLAKIK